MLTRLKVNGFKNLVDVDVRFGPFTCIAGVNGSGKSNLFDAIRFLALLAEKPLVEAALSIVRGSGGRSADIRSLFHRVGDEYAKEMSFEAEMIIPAEGTNDLGQPIQATSTLLRYELMLALRGTGRTDSPVPLRIIHEELYSIRAQVAPEDLRFTYDPAWFESAIQYHQGEFEFFFGIEGETAGRLKWATVDDGEGDSRRELFVDAPLPRTLLSSSAEVRKATVALARQEMRSWRVLYLEPSAMRTPDDTAVLLGPTQLGNDGSNLAATLYRVAHALSANGWEPDQVEAAAYARVRNRLLSLLNEIREIKVERDDKREELELFVKGRDGTWHSARALSDGTLRFLALAVLEAQEQPGVLCIEEPENGIHPGRIPALLELLQGIAMDTSYPIEEGNPLRQVIISTHSPSVVMRVPEDSLVMDDLLSSHDDRGRFKRAHFRGLMNTWRDPEPNRQSLALGTLLDYLNPEGYRPLPKPDPNRDTAAGTRVMDRADLHRILSPRPSTDA